MWWFVFCLLLLCFRWLAADGIDDDCHPVHLDRCLRPIHLVTGDHRLSFPVTQDDLYDTCGHLERGERCTDRYVRRCMAPPAIGMVVDLISGAKNVIRLLCHNGSVQTDYLRYARCFKHVALNQCAAVVQRFSRFPVPVVNPSPSQYDDQNEVLRQFCCAYKSAIECQTAALRHETIGIGGCTDQPEAAAAFFQHYSREMSHSLLTEHCAGFTGQCQDDNKNPSAAYPTLTPFLVASQVALLVLLF